MTEAEWLACTNPWAMLHYLFCNCSDPTVRDYFSFEANLLGPDGRHLDVSERKLRLFYGACCRRVSPLLPDSGGLRLIEVAERAADGLATEGDLDAAQQSGKAVLQGCRSAGRAVETWVALANSSCLEEVWVNGKNATVQAALAVSEMTPALPAARLALRRHRPPYASNGRRSGRRNRSQADGDTRIGPD
jgi:hypothetical protein